MIKDISIFCDNFKENTSSYCSFGIAVNDFFIGMPSDDRKIDASEYNQTIQNIMNKDANKFIEFVNQRVSSPLESLLQLFQGPYRLIQKRHDKLLDYDRLAAKVKSLDKDKTASFQEELDTSKKNYEALNHQLLEELPILNDQVQAFIKFSVSNFVESYRQFYASTSLLLDKYYNSSNILMKRKDIYESHASHISDANDKLARIAFQHQVSLQNINATYRFGPSETNNSTVKDNLKTDYDIYVVKYTFTAEDQTEISLIQNSVVKVLKKSDKNGNSDWWLVEANNVQGYIPQSYLLPYSNTYDGFGKSSQSTTSTCNSDSDISLINLDDDEAAKVSIDVNDEEYVVLFNFEAFNTGELSVKAGDIVTVLRKSDHQGNSDWWLVKDFTSKGYIPSNYLQKSLGIL